MKKYLLTLSITLLLAFSNAASAINNPFNLITDSQLQNSRVAISELWARGESGSFTGIDNIKIKYKIFRHPKEIGAIVISSGRTESYIKYKEFIYNLNKNGYTVYIHDHRGQGFSGRMTKDTQKGHVWDFENYITDFKKFYDLKVLPGKHRNLFILGHSMGGAIATAYIEKYPNDFKAAALTSPMHQPDAGIACVGAAFTTSIRDAFISLFGQEPRYAVGQGPYEKLEFTANNKNMMTHSKSRYIAIQDDYDANDQVKIGGVTSHWLATACKASDNLILNARLVEIPVLVLQAEDDNQVTAEGQNDFCRNLLLAGKTKCESGQPVLVPGAFHEMLIESDEYRIQAITRILAFYENQLSGGK